MKLPRGTTYSSCRATCSLFLNRVWAFCVYSIVLVVRIETYQGTGLLITCIGNLKTIHEISSLYLAVGAGSDIFGVTWELVHYISKDGVKTIATEGPAGKATLVIEAKGSQGTYSGNAGCNSFLGSYTITGVGQI